MKLATLMAFCLMSAIIYAEDNVRRTVEASPDGVVNIINTSGSISVKGWSRNSVEVDADLGSNVEELIVERDGDEVIVKVKLQKRHKHSRGSSTDLAVRVPEKSLLKIASVSADITVNDVTGEQQVQSVSGDIRTNAFAADVDAETVSGDVTISGNGSPMRTHATAVSGDIELDNLSGAIEAGTVTGDVTIVRGTFNRLELNTTNGDMTFRGALEDGGRMDVETVNGDVDIEFSKKPSARFDIETFNGDIDNCFGPKDERANRYGPGRQLIFTESGGKGRVVIRTLNGDLRMCAD